MATLAKLHVTTEVGVRLYSEEIGAGTPIVIIAALNRKSATSRGATAALPRTPGATRLPTCPRTPTAIGNTECATTTVPKVDSPISGQALRSAAPRITWSFLRSNGG